MGTSTGLRSGNGMTEIGMNGYSQTGPSIDNYRVIARPGRDLGRAMTARQDRSTRPRTCAQAARLPLYTVPGGRVIAMPTDFWWAFSKRQARETRNGADDGATL